jgi:hypothetical protein
LYQFELTTKPFLFRRFNERPEGIYLVGRWLNPTENGAGLVVVPLELHRQPASGGEAFPIGIFLLDGDGVEPAPQ